MCLTNSPTQRYTDPPMQSAKFAVSAEATRQTASIIKTPWPSLEYILFHYSKLLCSKYYISMYKFKNKSVINATSNAAVLVSRPGIELVILNYLN